MKWLFWFVQTVFCDSWFKWNGKVVLFKLGDHNGRVFTEEVLREYFGVFFKERQRHRIAK